jgi:hypothetical protein
MLRENMRLLTFSNKKRLPEVIPDLEPMQFQYKI